MKFSGDFYGTGDLGAGTFTNRKRVGQKMELYEQKEQVERVLLVGIQTGDSDPAEASLDELGELAKTAGAGVGGRTIQNREQMHPATYIGKGKILELKEMIWETDATGIICDDELSSAQLGNLEQELECKVMDRTLLILDIFAARAVSSEGKIQVELAQLRYRASRLVGLGHSLSRLGGGIGTRGPGGKKLEMDRRGGRGGALLKTWTGPREGGGGSRWGAAQ